MNPSDQSILLVEDNEDDIFVMKRALKLTGINNPLQVVMDGQGALDYLSGEGKYGDREQFPLPVIILLDLKLPYISGFEVLRWIGEQSAVKSIPVIILTSSAEHPDSERAYSMGALSYLVKPPTVEGLQSMMKSLENYWLGKTDRVPVSIPK
jgi:CheY-like chemotaxis protein